MKPRNYTKEEFVIAINESPSLRQALKKLGVKEAGGNYMTAKLFIKELGLDTSHFIPRTQANKGKKFGPKRPIESYLSNEYRIQSILLKKRLLSENLIEYRCNKCKNTIWLDNKIPLELHHIDGNSQNNNLTNIELLCPNCHALTDNYRGKNIKESRA